MKKRITKKTIKNVKQTYSFLNIIKLNYQCSVSGFSRHQESFLKKIWSLYLNILMTFILVKMTLFFKMNLNRYMKRSFFSHKSLLRSTMTFLMLLLQIFLKLMTICLQSKQKRTLIVVLYVQLIKWLIFQLSLKCQNNCFSLCSICIKVKLSNTLLRRNWWKKDGDTILNSICGSRDAATPISISQKNMKPATTTRWELSFW